MKIDGAFDAVMTRLKSAVSTKNDGQLAEILGLSGSSFANLKKRNSIPYQKVIALSISKNLNIHWLFTGYGECWQDRVMPSPLMCDPIIEKIIGLLQGLTQRQLRQVEMTLEDYQSINSLISQVGFLTQQIEAESPSNK